MMKPAVLLLLVLGLAATAHADPIPVQPPPCTIDRWQRAGVHCQRCDVQPPPGETTCESLAQQHLQERCSGADPNPYKIYCNAPPPRTRRHTLDKGVGATLGLIAPAGRI